MLNFNDFRSEFPSDARRSQSWLLTFNAMQGRTKRMRRHGRCWPDCYAALPAKPFATRPPLGDRYRVVASFRVTARFLTSGGMSQRKAPSQ